MEGNRIIPEQTMVVLLAAGKGTRMRSDTVKVCYEIDSIPAINRQIAVFQRRKFSRFLVVVGSKADQVLETVSREHSGVLFVHQEPQLGTGHAAKIAAEALQAIGYQGYVLVTMGDKYIEDDAIDALVDGYVKQRADMALLTIPKTHFTEASAGRVFVAEDGQALDIIEKVDIARQMIADDLRAIVAKGEPVAGDELMAVVARHIARPEKQEAAVAELVALAKSKGQIKPEKLEQALQSDRYNLEIGGRRLTGRQIDKLAAGVNPSLYLMHSDVFYRGVGMIRNDNAQGEYYITDMVRLLAGVRDGNGAPSYRVRAVAVEHPEWVQSFNSPDELLVIQDYVRKKQQEKRKTLDVERRPRLKPAQYATVAQWLAKLEAARPALKRWLKTIYGPHEALHQQKCKDLRCVLECYGKRFGMDEKVCIVRAPGRVNLMGRHVDHRGGMTNFLAIDRETLAVVGLRRDDKVVAVNTQPRQLQAGEVPHLRTDGPAGLERLDRLRQQRLGAEHRLPFGGRLGQLHQGRLPPAPAPLPGRPRAGREHGPGRQRAHRRRSEQQLDDRCGRAAIGHRPEQFRPDQPAVHRPLRRGGVVRRLAGRGRRPCGDLSRPAGQNRPGRLPAVPRRADDRRPGGLPGGDRQQPRQGGQERFGPRRVQFPHRQLQPGAGPVETALPRDRRHGGVPPRHRSRQAGLSDQRRLPLAAAGAREDDPHRFSGRCSRKSTGN